MNTQNRIGVIAIIIEDKASVPSVNELLSEAADCVIGRLGLPCRDRQISIIALIVQGTNEQVGALTGKLGMLNGVKTKSMLLTK